MATLRTILAALALAASTAAAASADDPIRWLSTTYDFGAFTETSDKVTAEFKFINEGDEDCAVLQVASSCGCTIPKYTKDPVAPGDTATIYVTYDPTGRPGRFTKNVVVRTTNSHERYTLTIKGVVIGSPETIRGRYPVDMGSIKLRNGSVMVGRVNKGRIKTAYASGYNLSEDTITPRIVYQPDYLQVSNIPVDVPPGELVQFNVNIRSGMIDQYGIVTDLIGIITDTDTTYYLPVVAIIEEDFEKLTPEERAQPPVATLSADRIDLGQIDPRRTKPTEASITLTNTGTRPLLIRRVYTEDANLTVKASKDKVKPGQSVKITAAYHPTTSTESIINGTAVIITNDPANPSQQVRIVGLRK